MDRPKITAVFQDGPLGCKFNHEGEVIAIKRGTQADAVPGLMKRDLLVSVGGVDTRGMTLKSIGKVLQEKGRPVTLVFERHKAWVRGENGLPELDRNMLRTMFCTHGQTDTLSLDAAEFFAFMQDLHKIRMSLEGRDLTGDFTSMKEHAQEMIDSHDNNDNGI